MDMEARILVWNYTKEEVKRLNHTLEALYAPPATPIEKGQGHLTLKEIIDTGDHLDQEFHSERKLILFHEVSYDRVLSLVRSLRQANLPSSLFAVVTDHSIHFRLSDLLECIGREPVPGDGPVPYRTE